MTNIARQHRERILARQAAEAAAGSPVPAAAEGAARADGLGGIVRPTSAQNEAQVMLVKLTEDRRRLKEIQSVERKVEAKRTMLPEYDAWLDGLIEGADALPSGERQDVLTTCLIWHIDAGNLSRALDLAEIALPRKIPAPAWYDRTLGCIIAEQVAEAVFAIFRAATGTTVDPSALSIEDVLRAQLITEDEDMPDEVRAKLFKAEALILVAAFNQAVSQGDSPDGTAGLVDAMLRDGMRAANRALELHPNCGVKKMIEKFTREQKKRADAKPADA